MLNCKFLSCTISTQQRHPERAAREAVAIVQETFSPPDNARDQKNSPERRVA